MIDCCLTRGPIHDELSLTWSELSARYTVSSWVSLWTVSTEACSSDTVVPVGKLPEIVLEPKGLVDVPELPSAEKAKGLGSLDIMKNIVRYATLLSLRASKVSCSDSARKPPLCEPICRALAKVHCHLPIALKLKEEERLRDLSPLSIHRETSDGGFREAWHLDNYRDSVKSRGMYEAGGSLYWLDAIVSMGGWSRDVVLAEEPSWEEVLEAERVLMPETRAKEDMYFSDPFLAYTVSRTSPDGTKWPSNLRVMKRLVHLYAWYTAMTRALAESKSDRVRALHYMALTVSIRVYHHTGNDAEQTEHFILKSLQNSEKVRLGSAGDSSWPATWHTSVSVTSAT